MVRLANLYRTQIRLSSTSILLILLLVAPYSSNLWVSEVGGGTIYVMFTFDTEDFLTLETNPVLGELVKVLDRHGVKGEFYIVAEKARVLSSKFPWIVEALKNHTIGYHQNGHSVHPTIAEYSAREWREAVEMAIKYETRRINIYNGELSPDEPGGVRVIEEVFGRKPISFRAPGYVWSAPTLYVLRKLGVKVSSVSSSFMEITGYPLNWYLGIIQIPRADVYLDGYLTSGDLDGLKRIFRELCGERMGRGLIIFGNHPCRLVTETFWDRLNYRYGRNPENESNIVLPPLYREETIELALETLDKFLDYVLAHQNVRVITSSEILEEVNKLRDHKALTSKELYDVAVKMLKGWSISPPSYIKLKDDRFLSLAESFIALSTALNTYFDEGTLPNQIDLSAPWISKVIGPTDLTKNPSSILIDFEDVKMLIREAVKSIRMRLEIPSAINVGNITIGPADLLHLMARILKGIVMGEDVNRRWLIIDYDEIPRSVSYTHLTLPTTERV